MSRLKKGKIVSATKRRSMMGEAMIRLVHNKTAMAGIFVLLIITLLCLSASLICPEGYNEQNIADRFTGPGSEYLLGTDRLGRSMLARILYGGRYTLLIGFAATLVSTVMGIILGTFAGYYGGIVDNVIMRVLDVLNSIPNLLMAIVISATLGNGIINTIFAVGIAAVPGFARTVRGPMLAVMNEEYIEAARSIDAKDARIMFRHILPNIMSPIIVQFTLGLAMSILCVSSLSFLGMGIQAPEPEWGALLSDSRQYLQQYPYLANIPGLAVAIVVLAVNLFGDGLRDALDPKLKY